MTMFKAIFIAMSLLGPPIMAEHDQYMKLYNINCEPNAEYLDNVTCELNVIGRQVVVANIEWDAKTAFNNLTVHFKLFKFYNQFRPFLIDVTFNVCDVAHKRVASNFYSNLVVRVISKISNSTKCVIEKV